jgi:hypothetical protein
MWQLFQDGTSMDRESVWLGDGWKNQRTHSPHLNLHCDIRGSWSFLYPADHLLPPATGTWNFRHLLQFAGYSIFATIYLPETFFSPVLLPLFPGRRCCLLWTQCVGLPLAQIHILKLDPQCDPQCGGWAFWEVTRLEYRSFHGTSWMGLVSLWGEAGVRWFTLKHEDPVRRKWLSPVTGPLVPWSWTFQTPKLWEIIAA